MNAQEYYETYSRKGETFKDKIPLGSMQRVKDILEYFKSPVLDIGCGEGYDVDYFSNKGLFVQGCDISRKTISAAEKQFPYRFFACDFSNYKCAEEKYNTVYAFDVIEHVFDYNSFLENIWKALKAKGKLILTTPNICGLKSRLKILWGDAGNFTGSGLQAHIRFFSPKTLGVVLERNKFKVLKTIGYSSWSLPLTLCGSLTIVSERVG